MTDYTIRNLNTLLDNIKNNPYGISLIKHTYHRLQKRDINESIITSKLNTENPINIRKIKGYNNRFELIYYYNNNKNLYIFIDIEDIDRLSVITIYLDKKEH